ncbi:hypothetical protein E1A91_D10G286800v1 [Gossypium mustelinum]|uniref:Uncharacterized protein n=1 Tax=Gossypium mustelinum TaxID=34275 RepID=A0A5D2TCA8_GOSMU|nr:hypothetical protein E1A91_D10G286800v1 [Gossypium mustelinum]
MHKLRYINISFPKKMLWLKKLYANQVESISLPDELRFLRWDVYPFKSLSGFNPKNLVVLKLLHGNMEQLWNEDDDMVPSTLNCFVALAVKVWLNFGMKMII